MTTVEKVTMACWLSKFRKIAAQVLFGDMSEAKLTEPWQVDQL
jgi:hypothetical protein